MPLLPEKQAELDRFNLRLQKFNISDLDLFTTDLETLYKNFGLTNRRDKSDRIRLKLARARAGMRLRKRSLI